MTSSASAHADPNLRLGRLLAVGGLAGILVLVASSVIASSGSVGPVEEDVFRAINGLTDRLEPGMWLVQQVGNVVVAFVLATAAALWCRDRLAVVAVGLAVGAKLLLERLVKVFVHRQRPGTSLGRLEDHGEVPLQGLSFVSGHATISTALAMVLLTVLPRRWSFVPWALVALNGVGRIYAGAHNPLDVVGGVGLGLIIGAPLSLGLLWARRRKQTWKPVEAG